MQQLTPEGQQIVEDLARRYGVSSDAVVTLLHSLVAGGGTMAQFSHPELGGMGQWSQGGMIMVGDMFNNALKAKVDGLCSELSKLLARQPFVQAPAVSSQSQSQSQGGYGNMQSGGFGAVSLFVPSAGRSSGNWWPGDLGTPSSTGAQNNIRYAYFPATRRLAIEIAGSVTVYDTKDHQISGVSQQQSGDASLTFSSQYGLVRVADLPVVSGGATGAAAGEAAPPAPPTPARETMTQSAAAAAAQPAQPAAAAQPAQPKPAETSAPQSPPPAASQGNASADEIFTKLERMADLHAKGILSDEEFAAKKAELLARL